MARPIYFNETISAMIMDKMMAGPARPAATPEIINMPAPTIAPIARDVASKRLRFLFSSDTDSKTVLMIMNIAKITKMENNFLSET
jgi:hypothetical protein